MDSIGSRLKNKRNELKLTLQDIKEKTGISTGNLSDIERGKYVPSSVNLIKLATTYNVTTEWILKGTIENQDSEDDNTDFSESELSKFSDYEMEVLKLFIQLEPRDQREIKELIEFKLFRMHSGEKLSTSDHIGDVGIA